MYSLANYEKLIRAAQQSGFRFASFTAPSSPGRSLLLRFDIDYSLGYAKTIARLNQKLGAHGTFFIRTRNNLYNPASYYAQESLDSIRSLGQSIALHIELPEQASFRSEKEIDLFIESEFALAKTMIGPCLPLFSWHNPSSFTASQKAYTSYQPRDYLNAYAPAFTQETKYISDSNFRYRFEELHQMLADPVTDRMQLLLHPCQWMHDTDDVEVAMARTMAHQIPEKEREFQYNHVYAKRFPQGIGERRSETMADHLTRIYFSE